MLGKWHKTAEIWTSCISFVSSLVCVQASRGQSGVRGCECDLLMGRHSWATRAHASWSQVKTTAKGQESRVNNECDGGEARVCSWEDATLAKSKVIVKSIWFHCKYNTVSKGSSSIQLCDKINTWINVNKMAANMSLGNPSRYSMKGLVSMQTEIQVRKGSNFKGEGLCFSRS